MAKGDVTLIPVFGSIGNVVRDFTTKEVVAGSFRHTQTFKGSVYTWKCGLVRLDGVVKLVEDSFDDNGTEKVFYRMEGLVSEVSAVTKTQETLSALQTMAF